MSPIWAASTGIYCQVFSPASTRPWSRRSQPTAAGPMPAHRAWLNGGSTICQMRRTILCAGRVQLPPRTSGCEQSQQTNSLFDHRRKPWPRRSTSWTSITSVAGAILVNAPTLGGWYLLQGQAVAISRTTGIYALLFSGLSRREGERCEVGVARIKCSDTR